MTLLPKFELNIEFQNGFQDRTNQYTARRVAPKDAREKTTSICQEKNVNLSKRNFVKIVKPLGHCKTAPCLNVNHSKYKLI